MNSARCVAAAGVVLAALGVGAVVRAGEAVPESYTRPQPAEPPGPLRVVTYYPETTTSNCISDLQTPLCGLESEMARWVRRRDEVPEFDYLSESHLAHLRSYTVEYKIGAMRELEEADVPPWVLAEREPPWLPGDVGIYLWERICNAVGCKAWTPSPVVHVMRKLALGWFRAGRYPVDTIFGRFADGRPDQRFVGDEPPGPLRVVTTDYEVSTSDCIMRPVTPLCAVETKLADDLHRAARGVNIYDYYNYKVMDIVRLDETNAPGWLIEYGPLGPPGYTGVVLWRQACGVLGCEPWDSGPGLYITRRDRGRPDRWEVF